MRQYYPKERAIIDGTYNTISNTLTDNQIVSTGVASLSYTSNGCCGSMKSTTPEDQIRFFCYPVEWLPKEIRTEKKVKALVDIFNSFGATLIFHGFSKMCDPKLDYIKNYKNKQVVSQLLAGTPNENYVSIFDDVWASFSNKEAHSRSKVSNYFTFCLVRALFNKHYQTLFLDMLDIKAAVPEFSYFDCFQLAHYGNPSFYLAFKGFLPECVCYLISLEKFKEGLNSSQHVNQIFYPKDKNFTHLNKLFKEKKYVELRNEIK